MQKVLLVLHIVAAGTWIGANVVQAATTRRVTAGGGATAASWMNSVGYWGRVLYTPAAVVLLATGIGMVLNSSLYEFSNAFVSVGFFAIIVSAVLGMAVFAKGADRAAAAFASGDDATGQAEVTKLVPWGALDSLVLLVAIIAMVSKWGV